MASFIYSGFSDEISPDIKTQFEELKKLGISHFEIRGVNGTNVSELTLEEAKNVQALAQHYGISASSIGSPIGKILITDPFEPHLELLKHIIQIAKVFKTRFIRVFSFYIPNDANPENYKDEVIARMKKMVRIAEENDVILLHENEKGIYGNVASRCKEILDAVNSPNLRAVFDPANFVECSQKTYPEAFELLKDYIVYMHIKDATAEKKIVPAGKGIGNVDKILAALKEKDYEGFVSLEPHLGSFAGLDHLQGDMDSIDLTTPFTPKERFKIAYESLKEIIDNL